MKLEQQIEALAELGLPLGEDVSIEDLLHSAERETYEKEPFEFLLLMFGMEAEREPYGRRICPYAWNLDMECIGKTGDYAHIVQQLCQVAKMPERLTDIKDYIDFDAGKAWLEYTVKGQPRHWDVELLSDWADPMILAYVMDDIECDGKRFHAKDNGQASIWFYLDEPTAFQLNQLSNDSLTTNG